VKVNLVCLQTFGEIQTTVSLAHHFGLVLEWKRSVCEVNLAFNQGLKRSNAAFSEMPVNVFFPKWSDQLNRREKTSKEKVKDQNLFMKDSLYTMVTNKSDLKAYLIIFLYHCASISSQSYD